jgi:4-diphosphocytidyl-2-C-methyl-D-erythritol kinase
LQSSITVDSYAKVNYTLDVLSLRTDGYHGIASVMQAISLADTITITVREKPGIVVECSDTDIPSDDRNLAWRAADAALAEAGSSAGLHIGIEKRIPSQAGLGGGSSNAAYTLLAVNRLLELDIPRTRMAELAAGLGSDVPFFLTGGTATARGRGEILTPLADGPPLWFVVVKPEQCVSTAWAYTALDAIPDRLSARATRKMEEILVAGDVDRIISRMTNDFEEVIFAEHRSIGLLHDEFLMARARNARLCGSGAAVFGVATDEPSAKEIARIMRLKYPDLQVCRAISRVESLSLGTEEDA